MFFVFNGARIDANDKWREINQLRDQIDKELNKGKRATIYEYVDIWKRTKDPRILELYEKMVVLDEGESQHYVGLDNPIFGLIKIGTKEAKDILRKGLNNKFMKRACIVALAKLGELKEMGPKIVEEKAYTLCWSYDCKEAIEYVRQGLTDKDDENRYDALCILLRWNDKYAKEKAKDILVGLLKSNRPDLRWHAADYLRKLIGKEAIPYLEEALKDYPPNTSKYQKCFGPDEIRAIIRELQRGEHEE